MQATVIIMKVRHLKNTLILERSFEGFLLQVCIVVENLGNEEVKIKNRI